MSVFPRIWCFPAAAILLSMTFSGVASAQGGRAAQESGDTEILFLGTGGGPPLNNQRSKPSTLLIVDGRQYLIDCGIGTMERMLQAGIQSEQIRTIFLTHLHPDHDLGLADVLANDFFRFGTAAVGHTVDVYGPPRTKELVDTAFRYIAIPFSVFAAEGREDGIRSPFVTHELEHDGFVYQDDRIRVIAAENTHYALMPADSRQRMKSYSYRIETPHGVVVFTGDTGPSEEVARLAKGADVLVTEVEDLSEVEKYVNGLAQQNHWPAQRTLSLMAHMKQEHLDLQAVGEMAAKAGVRSVILYHYLAFDLQTTKPAAAFDPSIYVPRIQQYFSGPIFPSADLDRYCLGSKRQGSALPALTRCTSSP